MQRLFEIIVLAFGYSFKNILYRLVSTVVYIYLLYKYCFLCHYFKNQQLLKFNGHSYFLACLMQILMTTIIFLMVTSNQKRVNKTTAI